MDDGGEVAHEERERFAVAAMAFCLKHSPSFRDDFRQFLAVKLGFEPLPDEVEFEVEPRHEADLEVRSSLGREFYVVVEFKIGASLKRKQDPRNRQEFTQGYGQQLHDLKAEGWANVGYIVIWQDRLGEPHAELEGGIRTAICRWDELRQSSVSKGGLKEDLFDCLGGLGVRCMKNRNAKKTMLSQANHACEVHELLSGVLEDDRLGGAARESRVVAENREDSWHYGVNFTLKLKTERLKGWLGYECASKKTVATIWFYCGSEDVVNGVKQTIQSENGQRRQEGLAVGYECPEKQEGNEREWFIDVLCQVTSRNQTP